MRSISRTPSGSPSGTKIRIVKGPFAMSFLAATLTIAQRGPFNHEATTTQIRRGRGHSPYSLSHVRARCGSDGRPHCRQIGEALFDLDQQLEAIHARHV